MDSREADLLDALGAVGTLKTLATTASGKTFSWKVSSKGLEGSGSAGADVSAGFSDGLSDVSISIFSGEDDFGLLESVLSSSLPFLSSAFVAFLQEGFDLDLGSVDFGAAFSESTSVTLTVTGGFTFSS